MNHEPDHPEAAFLRRLCGPQGLGEKTACALEQRFGSGEGVGGVEEEIFLRGWAVQEKLLIPDSDWQALRTISNTTSEHEVRYRQSDHRAVKRTWPGTFGFVPRCLNGTWKHSPAKPSEYLNRQALQNAMFDDEISLEGFMLDAGGIAIIGQKQGGLSMVISQPWLDAADERSPHPTEEQVDEMMKTKGFLSISGSFYGWESAEFGIVILDAKPDNFILTSEGILPIDLIITGTHLAA